MRRATLPEPMLKQLKLRLGNKFRCTKRILALGGGLALLFVGLDICFPPNLTRFNHHSPLIYDKDGALLSVGLSRDEYWRIKTSLNDVDPNFCKMLIHYEDKRFYLHPGIDPFAMSRALFQWVKAGKVISGGSTITLQTVRLLEPRQRTVLSKVIECLRALQLEAHFSKQEILEMYLSLAPYGGNVEGIYAASLRYFGKDPLRLRSSEAALLVVMPQLPNHLRPDLYPKRARKFRDKVIDRLALKGVLSEQQAKEAKEEEVPLKKVAFPRYALHVLNTMLEASNEPLYHYQKGPLSQIFATSGKEQASTRKQAAAVLIRQTSLQKTLQIQVEQLLQTELSFLEPTQTIAVLIVENKTRLIRAYVGNANFFDENRHGQINMVEHIRSPGSTLKPFIYGLGFDDLIIHPETILDDVPTVYGEYAPSNFRDIFHGEVTVREALQQSLNIPAITILDKIKPGRFMAHLQHCGVKLHFKNGLTKASLPIALGGVGITLKDLVNLYVALGNQGEYIPISLWQEEGADHLPGKLNKNRRFNLPREVTQVKSTQLLSPYATWHINHILEGTTAPDGFVNGDMTHGPVIAYKTGTSYGFRDAWALGYTQDYTIGVWVGKPDGTPSLHQTGRQNAAPLLFKLMRLLPTPKQRLTAVAAPQHDLPLVTNLLPTALRKVEFKSAKKATEKPFYVQFPKDGMILHVSKEEVSSNEPDAIAALTLVLKGGIAPYYLFCNGKAVGHRYETQHIVWQPQILGFHDLTIIDSAGHSESVTVELQ